VSFTCRTGTPRPPPTVVAPTAATTLPEKVWFTTGFIAQNYLFVSLLILAGWAGSVFSSRPKCMQVQHARVLVTTTGRCRSLCPRAMCTLVFPDP
jgi:hypothetical protein